MALLCLTVLSCGDDTEALATSTVALAPSTEPTVAGTPVLNTPGAEPQPTSGNAGDFPAVRLQGIISDVVFEQMTGMYQLPDGRWLIIEKPGRIMLTNSSFQETTVLMDLTDRVASEALEQGLLGLALAPDYAESGAFYVQYSASNPLRNVISRFHMNSDGVTASPDDETIILEVPEYKTNHNGGELLFGPDGYLYIGLGDGGGEEDPKGNGQDLSTLLGAVLRIDVSGGGPGYTVPPDNPFVGQNGARPEIWAYGFRNPWRFSFDLETGELWLGDVGENTYEEVNTIVKGGNYGWNTMEGFECLHGGHNCDEQGLLPPVLVYSHHLGCAISGGFIYHGTEIEGLKGAYIYSDFCTGTVWAMRADGSNAPQSAEIGGVGFGVSSVAQDNVGEIYVLAFKGFLFKLVPR